MLCDWMRRIYVGLRADSNVDGVRDQRSRW
jgi:hypothetical protein